MPRFYSFDYETGQEQVHHQDELGNVVAITDANTGDLVETFDYWPYGEELAAPPEPEEFRHNSPVTSVTSRTRTTCMPVITNLVCRGSQPLTRLAMILEHPQSWNKYVYAANSPVNLVDPDGRQEVDATNAAHAANWLAFLYNQGSTYNGVMKAGSDLGKATKSAQDAHRAYNAARGLGGATRAAGLLNKQPPRISTMQERPWFCPCGKNGRPKDVFHGPEKAYGNQSIIIRFFRRGVLPQYNSRQLRRGPSGGNGSYVLRNNAFQRIRNWACACWGKMKVSPHSTANQLQKTGLATLVLHSVNGLIANVKRPPQKQEKTRGQKQPSRKVGSDPSIPGVLLGTRLVQGPGLTGLKRRKASEQADWMRKSITIEPAPGERIWKGISKSFPGAAWVGW